MLRVGTPRAPEASSLRGRRCRHPRDAPEGKRAALFVERCADDQQTEPVRTCQRALPRARVPRIPFEEQQRKNIGRSCHRRIQVDSCPCASFETRSYRSEEIDPEGRSRPARGSHLFAMLAEQLRKVKGYLPDLLQELGTTATYDTVQRSFYCRRIAKNQVNKVREVSVNFDQLKQCAGFCSGEAVDVVEHHQNVLSLARELGMQIRFHVFEALRVCVVLLGSFRNFRNTTKSRTDQSKKGCHAWSRCERQSFERPNDRASYRYVGAVVDQATS